MQFHQIGEASYASPNSVIRMRLCCRDPGQEKGQIEVDGTVLATFDREASLNRKYRRREGELDVVCGSVDPRDGSPEIPGWVITLTSGRRESRDTRLDLLLPFDGTTPIARTSSIVSSAPDDSGDQYFAGPWVKDRVIEPIPALITLLFLLFVGGLVWWWWSG